MTNIDLKELIEIKFTGVRNEIKSCNDMTNLKLDQLIEHTKEQNNRVDHLEEETRIFRLIHRNPKASIIVALVLIAGIFVLWPLLLNAIF